MREQAPESIVYPHDFRIFIALTSNADGEYTLTAMPGQTARESSRPEARGPGADTQ
jgi:hypothetical protein